MNNKFMILTILSAILFSGCGTTKTVTEDVRVLYKEPLGAYYKMDGAYVEPVVDADTVLMMAINEAPGSGVTVADTSSIANNGTLIGGSDFVNDGKFGTALKFAANGDRMEIANNAGYAVDDELTISMWISPNVINNTYKTLVAKWQTTGEYEYRLALYGYRLVFYTSYNGVAQTTYWSDTSKQIQAHKWSHVAIHVTDEYVTFYINGTKAGQHLNSSGIKQGQSDIHVGQRVTNGTPMDQFIGDIDALKISTSFQNELTDERVKDYSGRDNHGANFCQSYTTDTPDGQKALVFNGLNDYVCVTDKPSLDMDNTFKIEIELKPEGTINDQYLLYKGYGGVNTKYNYYLRLYQNRPIVGFQDTEGTIYECQSNVQLTNGQWQKVTGSWNGSKLEIFIDGNKINETQVKFGSVEITPATNNSPLTIGRREFYNNYYFKGAINSVLISR